MKDYTPFLGKVFKYIVGITLIGFFFVMGIFFIAILMWGRYAVYWFFNLIG